jgi:hypothetical protein
MSLLLLFEPELLLPETEPESETDSVSSCFPVEIEDIIGLDLSLSSFSIIQSEFDPLGETLASLLGLFFWSIILSDLSSEEETKILACSSGKFKLSGWLADVQDSLVV